jgi:hypothetical protein
MVWAARVLALLLVAGIGWLFWEQAGGRGERADARPIWLEPGEYQGPRVPELDTAQVDAIGERARRLNF